MLGKPTSSATAPEAILIGGSAGAIEVVSLVLGALPADFRTPVVVLVHLPKQRPSALAGALSGKCRLALREPLDKEPLAPATVYLAPPDYHLLIDEGPSFALSVDEPVNFSRPLSNKPAAWSPSKTPTTRHRARCQKLRLPFARTHMC